MLALVLQPSLHGYDACMVYWAKEAPRRNCLVFCFLVGTLLFGVGVRLSGIFGLVGPGRLAIEVFNVGGWFTHGDLVLETQVDVLAVAERRLIPAQVRSEWARLRRRGLASVWAPACQDSSHVANAGIGLISMRGAPVSLPTFATAQFKRVFSTVVGRFGACFHLVTVGLRIWLSCMAIRELLLMRSSLL